MRGCGAARRVGGGGSNATQTVELDGWWPTLASYGDVAVLQLPRRSTTELGCAAVHVTNARSSRTNSSKFKLLSLSSW